ncbi:MAG TPA: hypothetical protein VFS35_06140 [Terrimicrobiaceae bacterium]|nr:hypothetical protein [Terrimicrobiaceae bacterium]
MKDPTNAESVVVGVFDNSQDLEQADKELVVAGFEAAVYDQAVGSGELLNVNPVVVGPVLAPGIASTEDSETDDYRRPDAEAFRSYLGDCRLQDEIVEAYLAAYSHRSRFLVVRTEPECVKHVMGILRDCRASRVDRHAPEAPV